MGRSGHGMAGRLAAVAATRVVFLVLVGNDRGCDPTSSLETGLADDETVFD